MTSFINLSIYISNQKFMETNIEHNNNRKQPTEKGGSMAHFFMLFIGFILFMIGLSYGVNWLLK